MNINNPFKLLAGSVTNSNIADAAISYIKLSTDITNHFNIDIIRSPQYYTPKYSGSFFVICVGGGSGGAGGSVAGISATKYSAAGAPGYSGSVTVSLISLLSTTNYLAKVGGGGPGGSPGFSSIPGAIGFYGAPTSIATSNVAAGGPINFSANALASTDSNVAFSAPSFGLNPTFAERSFLTNGDGRNGAAATTFGSGGIGGGGASTLNYASAAAGNGGMGGKGLIVIVAI